MLGEEEGGGALAGPRSAWSWGTAMTPWPRTRRVILTEKARCCRPNALLRLAQWLVNDINDQGDYCLTVRLHALQSVEDPAKFVAVPPPSVRYNPRTR